jgi:hypothetical protein
MHSSPPKKFGSLPYCLFDIPTAYLDIKKRQDGLRSTINGRTADYWSAVRAVPDHQGELSAQASAI